VLPALRGAEWQRQVFGLMGWTRISSASGLLAVASQDRSQCLMTAVVPINRCGAAPDSHRIPSFPDPPGR